MLSTSLYNTWASSGPVSNELNRSASKSPLCSSINFLIDSELFQAIITSFSSEPVSANNSFFDFSSFCAYFCFSVYTSTAFWCNLLSKVSYSFIYSSISDAFSSLCYMTLPATTTIRSSYITKITFNLILAIDQYKVIIL